MKILFVMFAPYRTVQMQIATLSAFLKDCDCKVRYLEIIIFPGDIFNKYEEIVEKEILAFLPDIVGFSSYDMNYYFIIECATFIKNIHPRVKTIVGGHHASSVPEDFMPYDSIDYVCIGEGEYVLKELIDALSKGISVGTIRGLCSRGLEGNIIYNRAKNLIEDLDKLPFIDRSIVHAQQQEMDYLPMFVGKGCPFNCTYCANESMKKLYPNQNSYVRHRSPQKIIEEITQCKKIYKFNYVHFYDDIFAMDIKWLQNFCELYRSRFPHIPFYCLLRPEIAASEKHVKLLAQSGCQNILIGVESGSQKYRQDMLGRRMTNKTILKGTTLVKKYKMKVSIFMMVGLPGETFLDMIKSLWINLRIRPYSVQTGIFFPIKNTPLYKYCVDHNLINEERMKSMLVYTYDTCLNYGIIKRWGIILFKWLNSATPLVTNFRFSLFSHFLRIQCKKWFKKEIDYK